MEGSAGKTAYAALDIGTSQVKLGVYCPALSGSMTVLDNLQNEVVYGSGGAVTADYRVTREKCFRLLEALGRFLKEQGIGVLYLGICGHVSSLLEWNRATGAPPEDPFPIWLDTTCNGSLEEYHAVMGEGRSQQLLGTFLPPGTNWLFTKLLHRRRSGFSPDGIFLQVGDALFHELTAAYRTHFSSQISLVDLRKRTYAPGLVDHLQLEAASLPLIDPAPLPVRSSVKSQFHFPDQSFVFPAMADLYTSLYGLRLQDGEGFMLANTSEQAGVFSLSRPPMPRNFLSIAFDPGFINYGSTNTGGNVVNWLVSTVLNRNLTPAVFNELTAKAESIQPAETPVILPYLQGERAPLWNSSLTASILELRAGHTEVHLFRAVLESIALARRQCFEGLGLDALEQIKLGGGSSKNGLWNAIRASVLNKRVAVADEKELSMAGLICYLLEAQGSPAQKPAIRFSVTEPRPGWTAAYNEKYRKFTQYQQLLS